MNGIIEWIHSWKRNGWKTSDKKPVKNADLWQDSTRSPQARDRVALGEGPRRQPGQQARRRAGEPGGGAGPRLRPHAPTPVGRADRSTPGGRAGSRVPDLCRHCARVSGSRGTGAPPAAGSNRSATRFITPSTERSSMPRTISAGESRTTRRYRFHTPTEQITFTRPCSSSRLMNVIPDAVAGRCRWVTSPATSTRRPGSWRAQLARGEHSARVEPGRGSGSSGGRRWRRRSPTGRRRARS